jgi:hypothetical protein
MSKVFAPEIVTATLLDGMIEVINRAWQSVSVSEREFMTYMRHLTNDDSIARPETPLAQSPVLHKLALYIEREFTATAQHLNVLYPNQTLIRNAFNRSVIGYKIPHNKTSK